MHRLLPVYDFANCFRWWIIREASWLPIHKIFFKPLMGDLKPILYKLLSVLSADMWSLGELTFDLGNVYLLACTIHKEINGIQHSKLERQLLMFLDVVMSICFCALTDLLGRPMSAIGQNISNPFSPDNSVK